MVGPQLPSDPIRGKRTSSFQRIARSVRNVTGQKRQQITLDWKEYFLSFCKLHGEPIQHGNVLLFRDGWRYAIEYKGPEFPPPVDHNELDKLVTMYWLSRYRTTTVQLSRIVSEREKYVLLIKTHSLPLQQTTIVTDGEGRRKTTGEFNLKPIDERIRWLRMDLKECETHLKELESYIKDKDNGTPTDTVKESSTSNV